MSLDTLHVTNGDAVVYVWKKAGLLGTLLAWNDALYEGPVLCDLSLEELSVLRARYACERGGGNAIKLNHDFERRNATLRRAREFDEVVLWFEHDLYDQLQLLQILAALDEMGLGPGYVQLVQSESYLGMQSPDELLSMLPKRRSLAPAAAADARVAWHAFTAQSPEELARAIGRDFAGLPFLRAAMSRLCEEYPDVHSGLSRTQRNALEAVAQRALRDGELFRRAAAREEASFHNDASFARSVAELKSDPSPLICELDDGYDLTVLGRRVLTGDADYVELQPLNRYVGGVHLTNQRHWRFDPATATFGLREA